MGNYKTNWQLTETVMPEDFNRIEKNIKENNKNHSNFETAYDKTLKEQNKKIDAKSEKSDVVLKVPQRLTVSIDLNTVCTGGNYVIDNATNSPSRYGRLVVLQWDSYAKWVTQILYSDSSNEMYTRCSLNEFATSWTPWQKILNVNEGDNKYFRTYIGSVSDFNNAKTQGIYHVAGDYPNAPSTGHIYGMLEVLSRDNHRTQRFTDIYNKEWTRFYNSGSDSWTPWSQTFNDSRKPTWDDVTDKPSVYKTDLGLVTDFNLCINTGMYKVANPQPFKNGPTGCSTYGILEVIEYNSTYETIQRYIDANGNMYTRFKNNSNGGTWNTWNKVFTSQNKPTWDDVTSKPSTIQLSKLTEDNGYGKNITGQDLNNITLTGFYDGEKIVNAPSTEWWYIEVQTHSFSTDYVQQVATSLNGELPKTWKRIRVQGVWKNWVQVFNVNESDTRYFVQNHGNVIDFNVHKTPGIYTISGIIANSPQSGNIYGTLEVVPRGTDIVQRISLSSGEMFTRYYGNDANGWRPWVVVYTSGNKPTWNDVANKPSSYTPASHEHDVLYARKNNGDVADFNDCTNAGGYYVGSSSDLPNAPYTDPGMGIYGTLEVIYKNNELIQRFTSNICKMFVRFKNYKGQWSSWNRAVSDKDFSKGDASDKYYTIYPDGTCIQWGYSTISFAGAYTNAKGYAYYPVPFKSNICTGNVSANSWTGYSDITCSVVDDSSERAFIEVRRVDGQSPGGDNKNVRVNWIAIGRV